MNCWGEKKMLMYVDISLFDSPAQTLVNTVNTVGVMGKGIAAVFKKLYPEMYQRYRRLCKEGKLDVGLQYIYRTPNKIVVNFPTKKHWRQRSRVEYIETGLEKFVVSYGHYGISSVSFPQLGCGHGELDWETQVQPVMEHYLRNLPIPVYIHLYPKPPDFIPERLNADYAKQVRLERQRISTDQLWRDLQKLIGQTYHLTLFGPVVEMAEEHILFKPLTDPGKPAIVYREDIEDLWNTLRLRGTVREGDVPQPIQEEGADQWLFELLEYLDYIQPIRLRSRSQGDSVRGLRYAPHPAAALLSEAEIVV
jgi:O-acetyl-ADP-ribose deacetylase (regulator of RNase III)